MKRVGNHHPCVRERSTRHAREYPHIHLWKVVLSIGALLWLGGPALAIDLQNWDKKFAPASKRFQVLKAFNKEAVLDKETQLVWEQSPDMTTRSWSSTLDHCANRTTGGRMGWRLPSAPELASLVDPSNPGGDPDLPPLHPFDNILLDDYWSATTNADDSSQAWDVNFEASDVVLTNDKINSPALAWCVRGGVNADQH